MKTVYLHIGTHRTGSTSIQRFLADAESALAKRGIIYPKTGRPDTDWSNQYGHHVLHWSLTGKHGGPSEQVWHDLREEISEREGGRVVLSAEGFEWEGDNKKRQIQRAVGYLAPHPIRVIVYLRPPIHFLRSVYKKRVAMGTWAESFIDLVKRMIPRVDYGALVARWKQFDRVETVDVRLFEKAIEGARLEADFAEAIGTSPGELSTFFVSPTNVSPPSELVQVSRWINRLGAVGPDSERWRTLTSRARGNVLDRRWPGRWVAWLSRPFLRDSIISEQAVNLLQNELVEPHRRFLERHIPPEDRHYLEL